MLAAVGVAVSDAPAPAAETKTARRPAITPAVARASHIDPRVSDRFRDGRTIALDGLGAAVLDLVG